MPSVSDPLLAPGRPATTYTSINDADVEAQPEVEGGEQSANTTIIPPAFGPYFEFSTRMVETLASWRTTFSYGERRATLFVPIVLGAFFIVLVEFVKLPLLAISYIYTHYRAFTASLLAVAATVVTGHVLSLGVSLTISGELDIRLVAAMLTGVIMLYCVQMYLIYMLAMNTVRPEV